VSERDSDGQAPSTDPADRRDEAADTVHEGAPTAGAPGAEQDVGQVGTEGLEPGSQDAGPERGELPKALPVLPLGSTVAFPGMVLPLHVEDEARVRMIEGLMVGDRMLVAVAVRPEAKETGEVGPSDLYKIGSTCVVLQMLRMPDGSIRLAAQGLARSRIEHYLRTDPHLEAQATHLSDEEVEDTETEALLRNLRDQFVAFVEGIPNVGDAAKVAVANIDEPGPLCDLVAVNLRLSVEEKQQILETLNVKERLQEVTRILAREMDFMDMARRIQSEARGEIDKSQREYYLRQQLRAIQDQLGETSPQEAEVGELKAQLDALDLPEEARREAERELGRLGRISPASPEYSVARTYLDWVVSLPWSESTTDNLDLDEARRVLDEDHFGLEDVKERVLELLAVCRLRGEVSGSILCFVGPPGTGKTSIGKSVARALGRKYVRAALGGIRDEAEIRGHRRTYIGSLPGRIISSLRKAGSRNPVFMLDEVDKLGADFRGDPASALLEVLDPEQNSTYTDHYLEVPFDLSKVLFICTANFLDPVPPALRDRMEVLEFPGYIDEEKLQIAKRYLVPQQVERNGLTPEQLGLTDSALRSLIGEYTREAGVRNLERQIASLCRKVAKKVAAGEVVSQVIDSGDLPELLGPAKFTPEVAERVDEPGVAAGLAWTPTGGDIIFVEATMTRGSGKLLLTGMLGDVMKESAQAALTFVRARAERLGLGPDCHGQHDFHIHVPAGAIPKDGPSAGITMAVALGSLCSGRRVRHDVAMTGEITLRGKVLPVGGVKEKVLAACRAGIEAVILPEGNVKDLRDVPDYAKDKLQFIPVETVDQVFAAAFEAADGAAEGQAEAE
jgi:ATP-dependent Lon protease